MQLAKSRLENSTDLMSIENEWPNLFNSNNNKRRRKSDKREGGFVYIKRDRRDINQILYMDLDYLLIQTIKNAKDFYRRVREIWTLTDIKFLFLIFSGVYLLEIQTEVFMD